MRGCAKMRCSDPAVATVAMRYAQREVLVADLVLRPDPNLLDLCGEHADSLKPPIGWNIRDERAAYRPEPALAPHSGDGGYPQMGNGADLAGRPRE